MESCLKSDDLGGEFQLWEGEAKVAYMMFSKPFPDRIIIQHTSVEPNQTGKGLGKILFKDMVAYAGENNLSVVPRCNFTQKMFDKHPEYQSFL